MDRSRFDARTVALALLCLAVVAFAAATLDSTTDPGSGLGLGGSGEDSGDQPQRTAADPGESDDGRPSIIDVGFDGVVSICVAWLKRPLVQAALVSGLVGIFLAGRWYESAGVGLAAVFVVAYPGVFVYLLLTSCRTGPMGLLPDLSRVGPPAGGESGGLLGNGGSVASPSLLTQLLVVLVVGLLGVVAVLVLTGDHDQLAAGTADDEDDRPEPAGRRVDVSAIGAAAGRAADRIEEEEGAFENEVYRAWAEMTEPLSVDHPESSTPAEFADAAVAAGMDPSDVGRLTGLFETVRYGGAEPTAEREAAAVETLRRIEAQYADADDGGGGS